MPLGAGTTSRCENMTDARISCSTATERSAYLCRVRFEKILVLVPLLTLLAGCAGRKAFLDFPAEQRQHIRFAPQNQKPQVRFASDGARNAREFGGIIGLAIAESIEHSTNAFGKGSSVVGSFEAEVIQDLFLKRLRAASIGIESSHSNASRLELRVHSVGLREVERERFAPFAYASARLAARDGKELWAARVQSTGARAHALQQFRENPESYRNDFNEVAQDLVNQMVEGPIRAVAF